MKTHYILIVLLLFGTSTIAQIINFPDVNFKNALLASVPGSTIAQDALGNQIAIDDNSDGEIDMTEALAVYQLKVNSYQIADMTGIANFTNVTNLNCGLNQIDTLDLTQLANLLILKCTNNGMTSLLVNGLSNLQILEAFSNQLTAMDFSGLVALTDLKLSNNQFSTLDVSILSNLEYIVASYMNLSSLTLGSHPNLTNLECVNTNVTNLDLSGCTGLQSIICYGSQINSLDISNLVNLGIVNATDNQMETINLTNTPGLLNLNVSQNNLTFIDASDCTNITSLSCNSNQLETIIIKNGQEEQLYFGENPNLQYICCDPEQIETINNQVLQLELNINVNNYCTLTPGGEYYNINGVVTYDFNNDGCDPTETPVPHVEFNYTNEGITGSFFGTMNGDYLLYPQTGSTTITPVLENPDYFSIAPTSLTVNFPTDTNPFLQNFCVVANGVHPDLEIILISRSAARPGFDAEYQIFYTNNGNQILSGDITLTYMDTLMVFLLAMPDFDAQTTSTFSWNFTDIEPFETRVIDVSFNINAPTDTPPVEIDDTLIFTTSITPLVGDENPDDNIFELSQNVLGSFDPNDITCLQGKSVAPETVGDYIHYLIRFENTGTFAAENIVVRNDIDLLKFDMDSFRTVNGSHPFMTRVDANKVEFIFEGVNLPFDDANNDGFVLYKIRTLPTLIEGDTFSNTAEIYFDFNFPIITNTFVTTIETQLGVKDFTNYNAIMIYPNPSDGELHITSQLQIETFEVLNMMGQTVIKKSKISNDNSVDISSLKTGNYFLKILSDKGLDYIRFIKK